MKNEFFFRMRTNTEKDILCMNVLILIIPAR